MTLTVLIIGLLSVVLLTVATWRRDTRPLVRALLVISTSACLCLLLTESYFSLALLAVNALLVMATWTIARKCLMTTRWGVAWILVLILILVGAKLTQQGPLIGVAGWIGISYFSFRLLQI